MDGKSVAGGTTVVGAQSDIGSNGDFDLSNSKRLSNGKAKQVKHVPITSKFDAQPQDLEATRPFFVSIGKDGVIAALQKLDGQLVHAGQSRLISRKKPTDWIGNQVAPGQLGMINHGGLPKVLTQPGRYPGFPLRNWWARKFCGIKGSQWAPFKSSLLFAELASTSIRHRGSVPRTDNCPSLSESGGCHL
jgi:hypothetical protein